MSNTFKAIIVVTILFFISSFAYSQKISFGAGFGFGGLVNSNGNNTTKGTLFINGFYNFSNNLLIGVEFGFAGNINPLSENTIIESIDQIVFSPYASKSNISLLKGIYLFKKKKVQPYIALGIGNHRYFQFIHVNDVSRVKQSNFVIQPEVGLQFVNFQINLKYLSPAKTPEFNGLTSEMQEASLESVNLSMWSLNVALFFGAPKE